MATSPATVNPTTNTSSLSRQPKYYEADGALRAFANRSIIFAVIAGITAVGAIGGVIFVRVQPPTVIRVLPSGEATVVSPDGTLKSTVSSNALTSVAADEAPSAYEKEAFVRTFLDRYLNYDAHTIATNWSYALNMMTGNLRTAALAQFQKNDTVGTYENERVRSVFKISHIEPSGNEPLSYMVYGVRTAHRMAGGQTENIDELVESYQIALAESERTRTNPTGLLIGRITQTQLHAESKTATYTGQEEEDK